MPQGSATEAYDYRHQIVRECAPRTGITPATSILEDICILRYDVANEIHERLVALS